ncbi:ECF transporter S component [Sporanaerobacter acetigenes]|uniref:ECF transporter S component n=1 Tax=Sporanaerobacter acetigenes TaxID=165813 RepID=UPI0010535000|nr:ECF transporter S component [Sporanaerobacter acetigenes]
MDKKMTTEFITRTAILLAIALVLQMTLRGVGQPLVGPLINFVLIMSVYLVSVGSGIIVGCLTPLLAFAFGITPFFPIVPFIMIGNVLYVTFFNFFKNRIKRVGDIYAIIFASLIKYAFLTISVRYIVVLFAKVSPKIIAAFSLPQLYTALVGGVLAIIVKRFLPKSMFLHS